MFDARGLLDDLDALDDAITDAAQGGGIGTGWEIEPSLATTIRTVAAMQRSARPDPAFTARLSAQLTNEVKQASPGRGSGIVSRFQAFVPSPAAHAPSMARPSSPRRWVFAQASLALLLVVLAGGLWLTAFRGDPEINRTFAVSILVPERGTGTTTAYYGVYLRRVSFEPGARFIEFSTGSTLILVEEGTFGVRGTGLSEETYEPNETFGFAQNKSINLQNISNGTGTLLIAGLYPLGMSPSLTHIPKVDVSTVGSGIFEVSSPDPVQFTLWRETVPAGEKADIGRTQGPAMIRIEEGGAGLTMTGANVPAPFQSGVENAVVTGRNVLLPADVNVIAHNTGVTPLVLTIIAISPVSQPIT